MTLVRTRTFSLWMSALVASAALAGGIEKDPKGEGRKDPREQSESMQSQRSEVSKLKRDQLLMRIRLKAQLKKLDQELDANSQDAAAGLGARKKIPVKQVIKVKALAKVVGGKNPHEVKAVGMDGEARKIEADFNQSVEAAINDKPIFVDHVSTRGRYPDVGTDAVSRLSSEERNQNKKDVAELEREVLESIGDMPEIQYFISQTPAERKAAMGSPEVLSSRENIRRWRQIAVRDPDRDVRRAAHGRLQRAGEGLAMQYVLTLKPYEQRVFKDLDPYDASARAFLNGLLEHEVGNENLRRVAATLLYKFPVASDATGEANWVSQVEAGENPEIIPTPADWFSQALQANDAKADAENAAVKASPYAEILKDFPEAVRRAMVVFDPKTLAGNRQLRALKDGSTKLPEVSGAYDPQVIAAASALLAAQPLPKLGKSLRDRAWTLLLSHDVDESTLETFDKIDFSSKARAEKALQARIVDFAKYHPNWDSLLATLVIETVLRTPEPGSAKALLIDEMSTMSVKHMGVFAKYLRIEKKSTLLEKLREERQGWHQHAEQEASLDRVIRALEKELEPELPALPEAPRPPRVAEALPPPPPEDAPSVAETETSTVADVFANATPENPAQGTFSFNPDVGFKISVSIGEPIFIRGLSSHEANFIHQKVQAFMQSYGRYYTAAAQQEIWNTFLKVSDGRQWVRNPWDPSVAQSFRQNIEYLRLRGNVPLMRLFMEVLYPFQ